VKVNVQSEVAAPDGPYAGCWNPTERRFPATRHMMPLIQLIYPIVVIFMANLYPCLLHCGWALDGCAALLRLCDQRVRARFRTTAIARISHGGEHRGPYFLRPGALALTSIAGCDRGSRLWRTLNYETFGMGPVDTYRMPTITVRGEK
jgi:hypothetical protein